MTNRHCVYTWASRVCPMHTQVHTHSQVVMVWTPGGSSSGRVFSPCGNIIRQRVPCPQCHSSSVSSVGAVTFIKASVGGAAVLSADLSSPGPTSPDTDPLAFTSSQASDPLGPGCGFSAGLGRSPKAGELEEHVGQPYGPGARKGPNARSALGRVSHQTLRSSTVPKAAVDLWLFSCL